MTAINTAIPTAIDTTVPTATVATPAPVVSAEEQAAIDKRIAEITIGDSASILTFGSAAQSELQKTSRGMLAGVQNKEMGASGEGLGKMVTVLRGFSVQEDDLRDKTTWLERLTGKIAPLMQFKARFETVQQQIEEISASLLTHQNVLLKDIASLDRLYKDTLSFYQELALYIKAGETAIARIRAESIPAKEAEMRAASEDEAMIRANELRDLQAFCENLERRVHDMKLTRQVTMQSLPSIRMVQENDNALVSKIQSTLINTVPAWENQMAQAITIQRSKNAAETLRATSDLTNELLTRNAENLRQGNLIVRSEMERGIFDIAAIQKAQESLIGTIEDSLRIADEGKAKRAEAEQQMIAMENQLKNVLTAASAPKAA